MRKTLLSATALAALIVSPALADDTATPNTTLPSATTAPAASPAAPTAAQTTPAAPAADTAAAGAPKFIDQQQPTEVLASSLVGAPVSDPSNKDLGKVTDVTLTQDGKIDAIVIGVGGFLGIGTKNVAVSYSNVRQTTDDKGNVKLVLDSTKDQLNTAPAYVTVAMLKEQQQEQQMENANGAQPSPISPD